MSWYEMNGLTNYGAAEAERIAQMSFRRLLARSWLLNAWATLTRSRRRLLELASVAKTGQVVGQHYAGIQSVPIRAICGSEGRCNDFDGQFQPVHAHAEARWASVATAVHLGVPLPPVHLIQIGDRYFVRDGHHRISVMRAFGQCDIDAIVTVWCVADVKSATIETHSDPGEDYLKAPAHTPLGFTRTARLLPDSGGGIG